MVKSLSALIALFVALLAASPASATEDGVWRAGAYTFSDELGGFRILSVKGSGTKDDPAIITQEFQSASPVTLVIRILGPIRPYANDPAVALGETLAHLHCLMGQGKVRRRLGADGVLLFQRQ